LLSDKQREALFVYMYQCLGEVRCLCIHGSSLFFEYSKISQQGPPPQEIGNNALIHAASYTAVSKSALKPTHPFNRGKLEANFARLRWPARESNHLVHLVSKFQEIMELHSCTLYVIIEWCLIKQLKSSNTAVQEEYLHFAT
jgi:hypothetical protein